MAVIDQGEFEAMKTLSGWEAARDAMMISCQCIVIQLVSRQEIGLKKFCTELLRVVGLH